MAQYVANVPIKFKTISVVVGSPQVLDVMSFPIPTTITAIPGASGTLNVEYSTTPYAAGNPGSATWTAWPSGLVSAATSDVLMAPVAALRFTAATSTGTAEVSA